jgi:excinuclease ABC subunit B
MYADRVTGSMQRAIDETNRRRGKQLAYNKTHGITPKGIQKKVADIMEGAYAQSSATSARRYAKVAEEVLEYARSSPDQVLKQIKHLEQRMYQHARDLEFEEAANLRDEIARLRGKVLGEVEVRGD